jgi:hypothetical protein
VPCFVCQPTVVQSQRNVDAEPPYIISLSGGIYYASTYTRSHNAISISGCHHYCGTCTRSHNIRGANNDD